MYVQYLPPFLKGDYLADVVSAGNYHPNPDTTFVPDTCTTTSRPALDARQHHRPHIDRRATPDGLDHRHVRPPSNTPLDLQPGQPEPPTDPAAAGRTADLLAPGLPPPLRIPPLPGLPAPRQPFHPATPATAARHERPRRLRLRRLLRPHAHPHLRRLGRRELRHKLGDRRHGARRRCHRVGGRLLPGLPEWDRRRRRRGCCCWTMLRMAMLRVLGPWVHAERVGCHGCVDACLEGMEEERCCRLV